MITIFTIIGNNPRNCLYTAFFFNANAKNFHVTELPHNRTAAAAASLSLSDISPFVNSFLCDIKITLFFSSLCWFVAMKVNSLTMLTEESLSHFMKKIIFQITLGQFCVVSNRHSSKFANK